VNVAPRKVDTNIHHSNNAIADLNDFNSTDDDGDTTNGDQHYKSVLHV